MKVLICGGRDFIDYEHLEKTINTYCGHTTPVIIQGGATGADFLAKVWAHKYGMKCVEYKADWIKYGNSAGPIRNKQMLEQSKPDLVIAFAGGSGTAHMIKIAKEAGVGVIEAY